MGSRAYSDAHGAIRPYCPANRGRVGHSSDGHGFLRSRRIRATGRALPAADQGALLSHDRLAARGGDLVQETYLRAWRAFESFEGRGSLKSWLYQIATRVCLDAITRRKKVPRLLPEANFPPATEVPTGQPSTDIAWLEPYPDGEVDNVPDDAPNAEAQYVQRESVRLAFVAALQYLPPVSARCCCSSTCWVGLPPRPLR
jgi:RNA polymerase sigma factor (sigma-70 family)